VNSGNPAAVKPDWPTGFFNHAIVLIPSDGSEPVTWPVVNAPNTPASVPFDPTNPFTPLGVLAPEDQGGYGLVVAPDGGSLVHLPVSDTSDSRIERRIDLDLAADGGLKAAVSEDCVGLAASMEYGEKFRRPSDQYQKFMEARVHRAHPLADDLKWTDDWRPRQASYHRQMGFSVPAFGRRTADGLMLVSPEFLSAGRPLEPWSVDNDGVSDLGPDSVDESVRIALPPGYAVEEMPDGWTKDDPRLSAEITYQSGPGEVTVTRRVYRPAGTFGKADYEALRMLYREVHDADRRSIVLREEPKAK
jgi:hypothetical protein